SSLSIHNDDVAAAIRFRSYFRFEFPMEFELPLTLLLGIHSHERCGQDVMCFSVCGVERDDFGGSLGCFGESTQSQACVGNTKISRHTFRVRRKSATVFAQCILQLPLM